MDLIGVHMDDAGVAITHEGDMLLRFARCLDDLIVKAITQVIVAPAEDIYTYIYIYM